MRLLSPPPIALFPATFLLLFFAVLFITATPAETGEEKACVILFHGLGRTSRSMEKIETELTAAGYLTVNNSFPSTSETIEELAEKHVGAAVETCQEKSNGTIHFVTHSMGGILVRVYLQSRDMPEGSRMVMLAPPNAGSEVADRLEDFPPYRWFTGPAGQSLGTGPEHLPLKLKPITIDIGVIAGSRSLNPVFSFIIPGPDDGSVAVSRTSLPEMKDFLSVPASHTFIMNNSEVIAQTLYFLEHGSFLHGEDNEN